AGVATRRSSADNRVSAADLRGCDGEGAGSSRPGNNGYLQPVRSHRGFFGQPPGPLEPPQGGQPQPPPPTQLQRLTPSWGRCPGRQILKANGDGIIVAGIRHDLVTNADGTMSASAPLDAGMAGRRLIDVLGPAQPLTTFGAAAGVLEIPLADGSLAYGTVRSLWSNGELAILHGRADAL